MSGRSKEIDCRISKGSGGGGFLLQLNIKGASGHFNSYTISSLKVSISKNISKCHELEITR